MVFTMKLFDFYGTTSQFTFLQKNIHKTNIGGILSIFAVIAIIWSIFYFGSDFYKRTNPNFIYERISEQNKTTIINNSNFFLVLTISDFKEKFFNFSEYFDKMQGITNGLDRIFM